MAPKPVDCVLTRGTGKESAKKEKSKGSRTGGSNKEKKTDGVPSAKELTRGKLGRQHEDVPKKGGGSKRGGH